MHRVTTESCKVAWQEKTENDKTELASGWRLQKVPDKRRTIARGSMVNRADKLKLSLLLHKELSQKFGFKNR